MTDSLPPSKFGAGYTYGGDAGNSQPAPPPPTSAYPQSAPPSYSQPPTHPQPPAYASTPPPPPRAPVSSYGAAGAPQYGAAAAAYPGSASGVTAIIAAVLALLLGAFRAYASIDLVKGLVYLAKLSGSVGMYMRAICQYLPLGGRCDQFVDNTRSASPRRLRGGTTPSTCGSRSP